MRGTRRCAGNDCFTLPGDEPPSASSPLCPRHWRRTDAVSPMPASLNVAPLDLVGWGAGVIADSHAPTTP